MTRTTDPSTTESTTFETTAIREKTTTAEGSTTTPGKTTTTIAPTTTRTRSTPTTTSDSAGPNRTKVERLVHQFINEERTKRGLEPLSFDTQLRDIARSHSKDMATRNYFSHISPEGENFADRYEQAGYTCRVPTGDGSSLSGGENIAQTWYDTPVTTDVGTVRYTTERELARGIVNQWMNSQDHRESILTAAWRNEGIGVYVTEDGTVYAIQNFC